MAFSDICLGISNWERLSSGSFLFIHKFTLIRKRKEDQSGSVIFQSGTKMGSAAFCNRNHRNRSHAFFRIQMVLFSSMMGGVSPAMFAKSHLKTTLSWPHNRNRNL